MSGGGIDSLSNNVLGKIPGKAAGRLEKLEAKQIEAHKKVDTLKTAYQTVITEANADKGASKESIIAALRAAGVRDSILSDAQIEAFLVIDDSGKVVDIKYNEIESVIMRARDRAEAVDNKVENARNFTGIRRGVATLFEMVNVSKGTRESTLTIIMDTEVIIFSDLRPEEFMELALELAAGSNDYYAIAGNDAELIAKVTAHNQQISAIIAAKMLPPENASESDYARTNSYVDKVAIMPIKMRSSELTQLILDHIRENNERNMAADERAYVKASENRQEMKIADAKMALRKKLERTLETVVAYRALERATLSGNPEDVRAAMARINEIELRNMRAKA